MSRLRVPPALSAKEAVRLLPEDPFLPRLSKLIEEDEEEESGWDCPRCGRQVKRDTRGRLCPHCGWYEGKSDTE